MDERLKTNRAAWDEMTDRHLSGGGGYRVEEFKDGEMDAEPNSSGLWLTFECECDRQWFFAIFAALREKEMML